MGWGTEKCAFRDEADGLVLSVSSVSLSPVECLETWMD